MAIIFKNEKHQYLSTDGSDIDWISVTTLIGGLKQPFDAKAVSEKCSRNRKSKWYGRTPEQIQEIWKKESNRAIELGTFYHNERESDICSLQSLSVRGVEVPVYKPLVLENGDKEAPVQKLTDGVYPEHFVYLKSAGICGQSDLVDVVNGQVNITDYKTNKTIEIEGFTNWEGITKKMLPPVNHLDDCNLMHYNLQLSIYMYIILKHNPRLKPGKLTIHHIVFEDEGQDEFGYPINKRDPFTGAPIVKHVVPYDLPYLREEVISIIHWLADNRDSVRKKAA